MNIDFEDEQMIIPKKVIPVTPEIKGISIIINHFIKDGVLIKRVEATGKEAIVFNGNSNEITSRYKTEFDIINALFVTFTPKTPEDYLCLIGPESIDFYALKDGMFCSLALPFKICRAHPSNFGVILERSFFPGEFGNPPGAAQLFSLTHPYNEILPILYKFKGDSQCHYTFRNRRVSVVSKDIGANWSASYCGQADLVMCYDLDERVNHIFMIRKCTKEERLAAKSDLGVLNSSALMHTPSTVQSFYSPNFFNRRFAETRLATLGLMNQQKNISQQQSPALNAMLFANTSANSNSRHPINLSLTSQLPNTANSSAASGSGFLPPAPTKPTPITRRITRSMAAAAEKMAFVNQRSGGMASSMPSTDKSPAFHRSLEHNATINRMRLKQKLALVESGNAFHTPRLGTGGCLSFSAIDMDDLLSFGGREDDEEPPPSLDMAVEFCLDWLWSEPPPTASAAEECSRSGSSSSVGTEKVANKLETLRVSSSTSSQSDEAGGRAEVNRMASAFFISRPAFSRSERSIVFHIPADRRVRVLGMKFLKTTLESPNSPVLTEMPSTFIRGNAAVPFLHAPFFMVHDSFSFSESLSTASSIFLYTGSQKVASIALNIGPVSLLRLLPAGLSADGHNLFEIRAFCGDAAESEPFPPAEPSKVLSFQLQLGFRTRTAIRCLRVVCASLSSSDRQLQFLSRLFCSNPWRVVAAAGQIPFVDEMPTECAELALLFEQLFAECGLNTAEVPFSQVLTRIRRKMNDDDTRENGSGEGCSATKRTRLDQCEMNFLEDDQFWNLLKSDHQIVRDSIRELDHLRELKQLNTRLHEMIRKIVADERRRRPLPMAIATPNDTKAKKKTTTAAANDTAADWISAPIWTTDLRVHNVQQMLDSSQPILIPSKALGPSFNEMQQREQHEQFLLMVALRTVARPFGRAALNFRTHHGFRREEKLMAAEGGSGPGPKNNNKQSMQMMGVDPICLNGRVHPGWHQVDFPLNDLNPSHKLAMDWTNFYNALAHGLAYCGDFPARLFTTTTSSGSGGREEGNMPTTVKAGLLLAAGLTGAMRTAMNLYDIHAMLTQNDRHLVIALLIGCAAAHQGTSEVLIYKMIATHLPFLLQPTLCEFRIELVVQTAALISLGLLFCETANYTVSSQLLNQMALEVPCESDQSSERYSFVLAAGMAIGLMNLGKGKELTDTEIPISIWPSLKDRLIKMLNGGERRLAYLSYDRVQCPGMRLGNFAANGSMLLRRFMSGGNAVDAIADNANNGGSGQGTSAAANHQSSFSGSGGGRADFASNSLGQAPSNHVRELPNLNMHLASPAAAVALGLMYLRTRDSWIRSTLEIQDTFYEIDKIRPDMLMIRTMCRCLVDFDEIGASKEWLEAQIPEIVRKYAHHFVEAKQKEDLWWDEFIDVETVAKAYLYCLAGACFAIGLRFASTCDQQALAQIHRFYELLVGINAASASADYSWSGLAAKAGRNCQRGCINVCALCLGLVMAGSGDLQTTRLLRKMRNTLPDHHSGIPPKDSSIHSLHISTNMALGLLYLGYGRYCLADTNLAIASLVISLFPLFPHSITDNRFYFQPIRFLWILAVKPDNLMGKKAENGGRKSSTATGQQQRHPQQPNELVDCPRCGSIEITRDVNFY